MKTRFDWNGALILGAMFIAVLVFWDFALLTPLKLFVVMLHELGHAVAAIATGGEVDHIEIAADQSGVCWSRGGIRILVLPAGYLGSMAFGGLMLVAAARSKRDKLLAMGIGAAVVIITLVFVRNLFGFGFGIVFGATLIVAGRYLGERVNDLMIKFLGLTSSLYAVIDIKEDLISRSIPCSDASQMAKELFLPGIFWGVLWILIALVGTGYFLKLALSVDEQPALPAKAAQP